MTDTATCVTVMDACGRAAVPTLLTSAPGMGKSSLVRALGAARGVPVETVLGSVCEPTDVSGLPYRAEDGVRTDARAWAKRLVEAREGIAFLDELTTSTPAVQGAMLGVVLDKVVGELTLPADVWVIAGANPADQAAGGYDLEPPMANRLCHLNYEPSNQEWLDGMMTGWKAMAVPNAVVRTDARHAAVTAAVTGFIQTRPDLLHVYPRTADATGLAWPSHRTWDMVTRVLSHLRADDLAAIKAAVFGLVGEGAGVEFLAWMDASDLPDPLAVLNDPSVVDWAGERPDRLWAVLNGVVTLVAQNGTQDWWRKAWGPMAAASDAGVADVAAAATRTLAKARPQGAKIPAAAKSFVPILRRAGLLVDEVAA